MQKPIRFRFLDIAIYVTRKKYLSWLFKISSKMETYNFIIAYKSLIVNLVMIKNRNDKNNVDGMITIAYIIEICLNFSKGLRN